MTKTPAIRGLLAGCVLLLGSVSPALAQGAKTQPKREPPTIAQMLDPRLAPKHDDVQLSTPALDEMSACTVTQVLGQAQGSSGWILMDGKKQPLRRFFDSTGHGAVDVWSYYKDGVEVYREFDTTHKGNPNNFRWLNSAGMKWGVGTVDAKGKAVITAWRMISAEEVGHEAFMAVAKQDFARLQPLLITSDEMQALKLPAARIKGTLATQQGAQKKFEDLTKKVRVTGDKFDGVETAVPQCDNTGDAEIIRFASRPIRYRINDKELGWLHTGELIQVGMTWKLADAPTDREGPVVAPAQQQNPELQKLLDALAKLDVDPPVPNGVGGASKPVHEYLHARIQLVQKIVGMDKADQREGWYRQLFDNLMAMAQNNCDPATLGLLKKLSEDVATQMPATNLAAYGVYRFHWTTYAVEMHDAKIDTKKITAAQDKWLVNLADFVKKYQKAEDTSEALYHLGNGSEFSGKIEEAKRWYGQLAESFPSHHLAPRARGCVARLSLVGNPMVLTAPYLNDQAKTFDIAALKGKVVIVHYWSSQTEQYKDDFARLARLMKDVGTKQGVELICVSLDDTLAKAREAVQKAEAPGIHIYQTPPNNAGGSNSALAIQYGVHMLPTIFVIGRDGKATDNAVQLGDLETVLKKVQ